MVEYINKNDVINSISNKLENEWGYQGIREDVASIISEIPAADVSPVEHGKWIDVFSHEVYIPDEKTTIALTEEKCSNCRVVTTFKGEKIYMHDYVCPNCGAKMDLEG